MKHHLLLFAILLISTLPIHAERYVGGDISMLLEYEQHNSAYQDAHNQPITDLITWLVDECGWNTFRVRLFVNPTNPNHDGVVQTTAYAIQLGQRIKAAGAYWMLDIHYSDSWCDATHIAPPAAWKNATDSAMADSVGAYTTRVLQACVQAGATPDLVQVGNEIMFGLCGIQVHPYAYAGDNWSGYLALLKAGCKAVRTVCPEAQIIIHTDRPCETANTIYYYQQLVNAQVDFDVIGLSYYPFWHGYLTAEQDANKNLSAALSAYASSFPNKPIQIVETAYNFQYWPNSGIHYDTRSTWPCSKAGQYAMVNDLITVLRAYDQVNGLCYWFPEEAGNGDDTNWNKQNYGTVLSTWLNRGFWSLEASKTGHTLHTIQGNDTPHLIGTYAQEQTAVQPIYDTERPMKMIQHHQLLIRHNGQLFTLLGQRL